jgi:hypothetical protein
VSKARREDNIKVEFKEVELLGLDWVDLAQERDKCYDFVNTAMNFQVR